MLKNILDFNPNEVVTLIPNSGVQFIDFAFDIEEVGNLGCPVTFIEDPADSTNLTIYPVKPGPDDTRVYTPRGSDILEEVDEDSTYSFKSETALAVFDNAWLPCPFFRLGNAGYDEGPTTWARMKVIKLETPDDKGRSHRLVIAFDTLLTPRLPGQPYTAPQETDDATDKVTFGFSQNHDDNIGFMSLPWIAGWLRDYYQIGLAREKGKADASNIYMQPGEYWAAYMALIDGIAKSCVIPKIELVDVFSTYGGVNPVEVSMVLDIGNSRMCGVLVEGGESQEFVDIAQTYRLELRDLSQLEQVYSEPFESRIEFTGVDFGPIGHASASQRTKREAFWWPSPVRVGPEAARLASMTDGTEGASGLSSPKRYLWDTAIRPQPWTNNNAQIAAGAEPQEIRGPVISRLTEAGTLVSKTKGGLPGLMRSYSRASMYMLLVCELLIQALTQINSVDVRRNRSNAAAPRTLKRVIMTLPTATPLAEQKLMRERIDEAVTLVWDVMGWTKFPENAPSKPDIQLDWDEATCTHLVYLYNEIQDKFRGSPRDFFALTARPSRKNKGASALRIASIDMGGGTTDLMILSHDIYGDTDKVLAPEQIFREGFKLAGDDILKEIIEHHLIGEISEWLHAQGVARPDGVISMIFGGNTEGIGQRERTMRSQLVSQVLSVGTIGLLTHYEAGTAQQGDKLRLGDLLAEDTVVAEPALDWFADAAGLHGTPRPSLLDAEITFDRVRIEQLIEGLVGPMMRDLCDLVRHFHCDYLLISGRPSKFPVFRRLIESSMPLPANRIVGMGDYKVGNWYPFRSEDFRIRDPKTTAVVGAMISHLCSSYASNLTLRTEGLKMRSTAKYIGAMTDEQIPLHKVMLENVDLDTGQGVDEFTLSMETNTFIGFRQLPIPRWRATPLYHVSFARPDKMANVRLPLKVTFERKDQREGDEEQGMEDFRVIAVEDGAGDGVPGGPNFVSCRLQTMKVENQSEAGYWLDTGVLQMRVG